MDDPRVIPPATRRHSAAHVMAAAVCRLYPDARLDIGPATDDGFYYDFDMEHRLVPEDFPAIEAEMARIVAENESFEREECTREDAHRRLEAAGQTYKLERLADIPEGESVSFYRTGDFRDLCRGPHVERAADIGVFKLLSVAGSYFRGDEHRPMLQRIYGVAFASQEELDRHLALLEEAQRRDHRKLGRELELYSVEEATGAGLILWLPRGARVRVAIEDYWRREHERRGYAFLFTPHLGRAGLWETSGHLGFYRDSMYAPMDIDGSDYFIKPMNCPFHIQAYQNRRRSYRELPLRYAELGTVYRYEKTGVLHGLLRVRGFTQDDAHIICTPEQIVDEIREVIRFAREVWQTFGFADIRAYLATRPEKAVGEPERWEQATAALEQALRGEGMAYETDAGGGAFYGPKIDLKVLDAIGREWQMSTVQFDFNLPERFDMTYTGPDGQPHRPYMVHRALFGSLERFFGILVEHYAGAFPLWLAPEQVRVLPLTDKQLDYARGVADQFRAAGLRVTVDESAEKLGAKIRLAQTEKVPYMAICGGREAAAGQVALRHRTAGDLGACAADAAVDRLQQEASARALAPQA
jgi:threonyl-tRNA synthetase